MLKQTITTFGAILLITACAKGLSDQEKSGAFGVPIPANVDIWRSENEVFQYKVSASVDELKEWYSARLIPGQNLGEWR